ncbi:unnamed protein product, partial [Adineta ricciae]
YFELGAKLIHEKESFSQRWHQRGCTALCYCTCPCQSQQNKEIDNKMPYTDDAYVLIRNHPLFVASEQLQYPDHVQQPFNTFLRDAWYRQNKYFFYGIRLVSFLL